MNSLKEVYATIAAKDGDGEVKEAAAAGGGEQEADEADAELLKQAEDYDTAGRILAHSVFEDMVKEGSPVGHGEGFIHSDGEWCDETCGGFEGAVDHEKVAAAKAQIAARMAEDPEYVQHLLAKHLGQ